MKDKSFLCCYFCNFHTTKYLNYGKYFLQELPQCNLFSQAAINDGEVVAKSPSQSQFNPYTEFKEFTRKQIKDFEKMFKKYVGPLQLYIM